MVNVASSFILIPQTSILGRLGLFIVITRPDQCSFDERVQLALGPVSRLSMETVAADLAAIVRTCSLLILVVLVLALITVLVRLVVAVRIAILQSLPANLYPIRLTSICSSVGR